MAGGHFYPLETVVIWRNKGGKVSWGSVLKLGNLRALSAK